MLLNQSCIVCKLKYLGISALDIGRHFIEGPHRISIVTPSLWPVISLRPYYIDLGIYSQLIEEGGAHPDIYIMPLQLVVGNKTLSISKGIGNIGVGMFSLR